MMMVVQAIYAVRQMEAVQDFKLRLVGNLTQNLQVSMRLAPNFSISSDYGWFIRLPVTCSGAKSHGTTSWRPQPFQNTDISTLDLRRLHAQFQPEGYQLALNT
ncbi:hypothetical protein M758_1G053000 [Ceratodon purpureus]|nr:hypothetical protein M758_1G053000 [Ceratodon purpureus]